MTDAAHMPASAARRARATRTSSTPRTTRFEWPELDERTASSLCYTSGTTGNPKGVLYSHRSTVLHSFLACRPTVSRFRARDSVLLVVPLFHVNAWGIPYASAMCGAKLVLPGPALGRQELSIDLAVAERCTLLARRADRLAGWFQHLDDSPALDLIGPAARARGHRRIGRAARDDRAVSRGARRRIVIHAWGMSETSPARHHRQSAAQARGSARCASRLDVQAKQGRAVYGVELQDRRRRRRAAAAGRRGRRRPAGARALGDVAAISRATAARSLDRDGWFATGDVATIDADGYVQITDRSKDVIKSGGEWIRSIDLENAAVAHPAVQEAAVIGVPHPKWQERPLLLVVPQAVGARRPRGDPARFSRAAWRAGGCRTTWSSSDALPHTATGKLQKTKLREQFRDHVLPAARRMGEYRAATRRSGLMGQMAFRRRRRDARRCCATASPASRRVFPAPRSLARAARRRQPTSIARSGPPWRKPAGWGCSCRGRRRSAGSALREQAVLSEALGRALVAEPLAQLAVFAGTLLRAAPAPRERTRLVQGIADGSLLVTSAWQGADGEPAPLQAAQRDGGITLDGKAHFVDRARVGDRHHRPRDIE